MNPRILKRLDAERLTDIKYTIRLILCMNGESNFLSTSDYLYFMMLDRQITAACPDEKKGE